MEELAYGKNEMFSMFSVHLQNVCKTEDSGNNSKYLVTKKNIDNKLISILKNTLPFSQAKHSHWLLN